MDRENRLSSFQHNMYFIPDGLFPFMLGCTLPVLTYFLYRAHEEVKAHKKDMFWLKMMTGINTFGTAVGNLMNGIHQSDVWDQTRSCRNRLEEIHNILERRETDRLREVVDSAMHRVG